MPDNNEKIDDFMSLWKKKLENGDKKPSVIGETLDKLEALQKENEELRSKIAENLELMSRTEKIIKNAMDEKERLKIEKEEAVMEANVKLKDAENETAELNNKIKSLVKLLLEKDEEIKQKNNEILELESQKMENQHVQTTTTANQDLVEELQSELFNSKNKITELKSEINELKTENDALQNQLVEKMKSLKIDYVVPIEQAEPEPVKPAPSETSTNPLEMLCQDLQSDLNKYKRIIEKLTKEKAELQNMLSTQGEKLTMDDLNELREENEVLKRDIQELQDALKEHSMETSSIPLLKDAEFKIKDLQSQLNKKDQIILELQTQITPKKTSRSGNIPSLVEELQNSINKLKLSVKFPLFTWQTKYLNSPLVVVGRFSFLAFLMANTCKSLSMLITLLVIFFMFSFYKFLLLFGDLCPPL